MWQEEILPYYSFYPKIYKILSYPKSSGYKFDQM